MDTFSEKALIKLNSNEKNKYYVYGLIDPRDNQKKLFYIGKGCDNRIFEHEQQALNAKENKKIKTIKKIKAANSQIEKVIFHYGLSETEAFTAEASLINMFEYLYPNSLTNIVRGHHSEGAYNVEDFEKFKGAENLDKENIKHNILVVKINNSLNINLLNNKEEVYNCTRGVWILNKERAKKVKYVFGVYNSLIVGVYKPSRWLIYDEENKHKMQRSDLTDANFDDFKGRLFFEDDFLNLDENQKFYLEKSIANLEKNKHSQNPIFYLKKSEK